MDNYPPGVSDRDIDEHFGSTRYCDDCGSIYDIDDEGTDTSCGDCLKEKECSDMEIPRSIGSVTFDMDDVPARKDGLPLSTLTKHQTWCPRPKHYTEDGRKYTIAVAVRHDDHCGNGHNTFSITGGINEIKQGMREYSYGCIHDEIRKHFPELAGLIKWHLCSTDGPLHYVANTIYHAKQHGPKSAWVYYNEKEGHTDPLSIAKPERRLLGYIKAEKARKAEGVDGYEVVWDAKTAKERNLEFARSSAIWPEATNAELCQEPEALKAALLARLPELMARFKVAVESLGLVY